MSSSIDSVSATSGVSSDQSYNSYGSSSSYDWFDDPAYKQGISQGTNMYTSQLQQYQSDFNQRQKDLYASQGQTAPHTVNGF